MIEPQSSEVEYRQSRLMAEAGNRRLAASEVRPNARRATHERIRRSLPGLVASMLRNLGLWTLLLAVLVVGGCNTGQGVASSAESTPRSSPAAAPTRAPSAPAVQGDPYSGCGASPLAHSPC
jgi:hypothetical protein